MVEANANHREIVADQNTMVSRRLAAGSRLVMVLSILKNPLQQINYGTGKDVSDESLEDLAEPLRIRWFGTSYVELPIRR